MAWHGRNFERYVMVYGMAWHGIVGLSYDSYGRVCYGRNFERHVMVYGMAWHGIVGLSYDSYGRV